MEPRGLHVLVPESVDIKLKHILAQENQAQLDILVAAQKVKKYAEVNDLENRSAAAEEKRACVYRHISLVMERKLDEVIAALPDAPTPELETPPVTSPQTKDEKSWSDIWKMYLLTSCGCTQSRKI